MKTKASLIFMTIAMMMLVACANATPPPAQSEFDLGARGFAASPDGRLRVMGNAPVLVALKQMTNPPAAPSGWELIGPVFDITARDQQQRPVAKFLAPLLLRFDVFEDRPLTVLVHDGTSWQIVPSELDADGALIASVDHLTPYTVGAPTSATSATSRSVTRTPAPRTPTWTPGARATSFTPGANATVTVATAVPSDAATILKSAAEAIKQKTVKISGASGYTGSLSVAVPPALQSALGAAIGMSGTGYSGFYNAVNQVVTIQAAGSRGAATGALSLLVEPKTSMPANASDAQAQLKSLFPGITATLTQATSVSNGYVFYAMSGGVAYSLGYVLYNNVPLAYAMIGTGTYTSLVPK
jgi:hypothetical protein